MDTVRWQKPLWTTEEIWHQMEWDCKMFYRKVLYSQIFRTDSFIKNRFYSKVRKGLRKLCKFAKVKTTKINVYELKPCTLTYIFKRGQV